MNGSLVAVNNLYLITVDCLRNPESNLPRGLTRVSFISVYLSNLQPTTHFIYLYPCYLSYSYTQEDQGIMSGSYDRGEWLADLDWAGFAPETSNIDQYLTDQLSSYRLLA